MLPSKTIPEVGGKGRPCALKATANSRTTTAPPTKKARPAPRASPGGIGEDEVEDEDRSRNITTMNVSFSSTSSFQITNTKKVRSLSCMHSLILISVQKGQNMKRTPVYLFYEAVSNASDGSPGDIGDVHYRCFHGAHKICTIKRSMKSNLNGVF
jgi:hypothetical protein